jgi:predicted nucleic acid-binding protein
MADDSASIPFRIARTRSETGYLLDTGVLVAIASRDDSRHEEAAGCLRTVSSRGNPIFVSLATIYESHRRILHALGILRAREFLAGIFDGSTVIVEPRPTDEIHAIEWIDRLSDQRITLTDAVNMAIMTRLHLFAVMSFDNDFLVAGFLRVPPIAS